MNNSEKGFIPVMLTPFNEDGAIDYNGLTQLVELYLSAGVSGLFANCLSSEMYELSEKERLELVKHVVKVVNGKVPVVATGSFGESIPQKAEFVNKIYDTGVQAVIAITGLLAKEEDSAQVFDQNVAQLLDLTGNVPLGFYECPVPYKRIISPEQLGRFVNTGRITYHKDTCLDIEQIRAKIAVTQGHNFGLYDAYMAHAVESLKAGSAGLSCIQGNFFPELVVWLCDNYNNDDEQVAKVQQFFIDHMDVMHAGYPVIAKYCLQQRGLPISMFTRTKTTTLTQEVKTKIDALINNYDVLKGELEIKFEVV
ncbi:dihydrodipicolinate synthase family protein [Pedobacter arcticus]|uniref:dihydrodipicolinate synthase family protein n=1 Tax=Pedobacter arcticus TaxID=752140 RepID=UPI00031DFEA8|nr:dihydrodipicolinate synthase family protein [Pedobacter arcticus]